MIFFFGGSSLISKAGCCSMSLLTTKSNKRPKLAYNLGYCGGSKNHAASPSILPFFFLADILNLCVNRIRGFSRWARWAKSIPSAASIGLQLNQPYRLNIKGVFSVWGYRRAL